MKNTKLEYNSAKIYFIKIFALDFPNIYVYIYKDII